MVVTHDWVSGIEFVINMDCCLDRGEIGLGSEQRAGWSFKHWLFTRIVLLLDITRMPSKIELVIL